MHLRSVALLVLGIAMAGCGPSRAHVNSGPMPEGGTFHGVWFSPQYGRMHVCQSERTVIGEYTKDERRGRIQGRADGNLLRFEWHERRELVNGRPMEVGGHGYFVLAVGQDGAQTLTGEWGYDDDEVGGGPWTATKLARERPTDCYASVRETEGAHREGEGELRFSDEVDESEAQPPEGSDSTSGSSTSGTP